MSGINIKVLLLESERRTREQTRFRQILCLARGQVTPDFKVQVMLPRHLKVTGGGAEADTDLQGPRGRRRRRGRLVPRAEERVGAGSTPGTGRPRGARGSRQHPRPSGGAPRAGEPGAAGPAGSACVRGWGPVSLVLGNRPPRAEGSRRSPDAAPQHGRRRLYLLLRA